MGSKYALIDFENVQPCSLKKLKSEGYQLKIFLGASQSKISVELAAEVQQFGERAQYIRLQSSGKNALDFHIAFYMGQLVTREPECQLLVVSKDTGYDPLLTHMRSLGIKANRSAASVTSPKAAPAAPKPHPAATACKKTPSQMSMTERVQLSRARLKKSGTARPAKLSSLVNYLDSTFQKLLNDQALKHLIHELIKQGIVIDNQGSITYQFNT